MSPDDISAQSVATQLLLRQEIQGLFIDVKTLRLRPGIFLDSFQHYCALTRRPLSDFTCDAAQECCVVHIRNRGDLILYNNALACDRRRHWGMAHELGHLYLQHTDDGPAQEAEAHAFASQLLMPAAVLRHMDGALSGQLTPQCITQHFNASTTAARRALEAMRRSDTDIRDGAQEQLLRRFSPFIARALACRPALERETDAQSVLRLQRAENQWLFGE